MQKLQVIERTTVHKETIWKPNKDYCGTVGAE